MSVADLYDLELIWPSLGPTDVIVTGTFDQWSSSIRLAKGEAGFAGTVRVPWGQKIAYKFIVDGDWQCRDDRPQEDDGSGNFNNVLQTPGKPKVTFVHDPPRLSIPVDGALSDGFSAVENMVTAVEFLPPAESSAASASLPLPIPQITVEGLGQGPSPVNESNLNTAAAAKENTSLASVTPAGVTPSKQDPSSHPVSILRLNDNDSIPHPLINGNGEAPAVIMTHAPIQFKGATLTSRSVPGSVEVAAVTPSASAEPESSHPPQAAQADNPPAPPEPTTKQPDVVLSEIATQDHPKQDAAPPSSTITPSTAASGTLAHKKRRSLFARIKRLFDKKKDKQEGKEKNRD